MVSMYYDQTIIKYIVFTIFAFIEFINISTFS